MSSICILDHCRGMCYLGATLNKLSMSRPVFTHVDVKLPKLLREDGDGRRRYLTPEGRAYPSITSVLSDFNKEGILAWRKRVGDAKADAVSRKATTKGTAVHSVIEHYLMNKPLPSMMPDVKVTFARMRPVLGKLNNIHCLETGLYSDKLQVAGTVDCIAEYQNKLAVIDFKTANRLKKKADIQSYFLQGTAYAAMYEELTGNKVEEVLILIGVESAEFPQLFSIQPEDYIEELKECINRYNEKEASCLF